MVDHLTWTLARQRSTEDTAGARHILTSVLSRAVDVGTLRSASDDPLHQRLLALETQYAQFLGWLHQDLDNANASEQWYARALVLAHEASDDNMIATVLSMRSNAAGGRGDVRRAVNLGEAATRPWATPGVLAFSYQQAARGYAAAGDADAADRALDMALELSQRAAGQPDREPPWVYFLDETRVELHRAIALRLLGRNLEAADLFRRALERLPNGFRRDRGQNLARMAGALAAAGEREEATSAAAQARLLARETGSDRTLRELHQVDRLLTG
jgi:tetratricopeptide (TPR) repeat protein